SRPCWRSRTRSRPRRRIASGWKSSLNSPPRLGRVINELVDQIEARFADLSRELSDAEVIANRQRYAEVGRADRALEPAHRLALEYRRLVDDAAGARELLDEDGEDAELREMLRSSEA